MHCPADTAPLLKEPAGNLNLVGPRAGAEFFYRGKIAIGHLSVSKEKLATDGLKFVPAGRSVLVDRMDVKFS
jgi:hypothetical protein